MVKLKNKESIIRYFKAYERGISQKYISKQLSITTRWFRELYQIWKVTGEAPIKRYKLGMPIKIIPKKEEEILNKNHDSETIKEKLEKFKSRKSNIAHEYNIKQISLSDFLA